ncbi:hypothetical protein [Ferruginibacter sp.]
MERMLQVSNVTQADRDAYNARPKPSYYDPNPLKTIFYDATIGAFCPIKNVDVYASGNIKHKVEGDIKGGKGSGTLVWMGAQFGFTTADNQGFYGNIVTADNSYLAYKKEYVPGGKLGTEFRGIPFRGLGVTIPLDGKQPKFGDYAPQFRVINDLFIYKGVTVQSEVVMGSKPAIGLRGKLETPKFNGWSAEVVAGARVDLQTPPLVQALIDAWNE